MLYFGSWKSEAQTPPLDLPPVPRNKPAASQVPDPTRVQDEVTLSEELPMNRFSADYYPLQLANHILGGGFYATRLYRDLRKRPATSITSTNRSMPGVPAPASASTTAPIP